MLTPTSQVDLVNKNMLLAQQYDIIQLSVEEVIEKGRCIKVKGEELINFASCSYLGFETDDRLIAAAIETIKNNGVHFSSSRSYLSLKTYQGLEDLMFQIFDKPVLITPSTTFGHLTAMPILIGPEDFVIVDQQVHSSVQFSLQMTSVDKGNIERMRHNRMDYLDNRINKLRHSHKKVWYLADGVYSMFGDVAPLKELHDLLERYEQFHLYIDDAHGMSWAGEQGKGYVLSHLDYHPKMILLTSLGKGFGTSGGAIVCYDEKQKELFLNCGGPMIFSGPLQPANLGAALACAKIHLTEEIYFRQSSLRGLISIFQEKAAQLELPFMGPFNTPIFYLGLGNQELSCSLCAKLKEHGFYTSVAGYPSVPYKKSGLRVLLTLHHSKKDVENFLETIAWLLPETLREVEFTMEEIMQEFKLGVRVA